MNTSKSTYFPAVKDINKAAGKLQGIIQETPLTKNFNLSAEYRSNILLKREDLQIIRSYKIRGAYNKIASLSPALLKNGVVCASAGNHAQGVAYACQQLGVNGTVVMPAPTPRQKIEQVSMFGKNRVEIILSGDTFDDAKQDAISLGLSKNMPFIHPFDDEKVIEGQGTVGLELLGQCQEIDYLILPVGGGGLSAGVSALFRTLSPSTRVIGVEPAGAPSMSVSLKNGVNSTLEKIEKFVDGAAVKRVGDLNFRICQETLHDVITVNEGKVCETILQLYNREAIVVEPAGALSIAALDQLADKIVGKTVVCVISGGNNDITRTEEIKERALLHSGLKHYFIVRFPQRAGALKEFVAEVLGPDDDITHFEYTKKNSREKGTAVVGIELKSGDDFPALLQRMQERNFYGDYINNSPDLLNLLI